MVSNARLDLPEPDSPVITISESRGSLRWRSLRLCSRAPETTISPLEFTRVTSLEPVSDRTGVRFFRRLRCSGLGWRRGGAALRIHDPVRRRRGGQPGFLRARAGPAAPL